MKKIIAVIFLILVVAAGAAFFYLKRPVVLGDLKVAEYLPPDTIAMVEITDMPRSKVRWQETALHKIAQEPEVAAFLAKPKSQLPANVQIVARLDRFRALDPKEVFIAVTGQGAAGPKVIGGFDFTGRKKDAEGLVADLKSDFEAAHPDGKSDLQRYGSSEIETFTYGETTVATVFHGRWFFAANDLDLLKSTLDRVDAKGDPNSSLRGNDTYKLCLAKLPADPDVVAFAATKGIMDDLVMMLGASPNVNTASLDQLKKIQAVSACMKFDGENLRDAFYVYKPGGEARPPLTFDSKAFTSPETVFYLAMRPSMKTAPVLPDAALDQSGVLAMLGGLQQSLAHAGLGFDDFKQAFGPELGAVMNWGREPLPSVLLDVDVRDSAKAQKFIDTLAGELPKQEIDGAQYYQFPASGLWLTHISPVLALTDKALVFGMDAGSVKEAVQNAKSGAPGIDSSAEFQAASALVGKPTDSFAYIDSRAIFDKTYGFIDLSLKSWAFFNPRAGEYADFGKLPSADAISKHLSPIVYSQSTDENGSLYESAGPVTFTEAAFGVGIGAGIVASQMHIPMPNSPLAPPPGQSGTTSSGSIPGSGTFPFTIPSQSGPPVIPGQSAPDTP